MSSRNSTAGAGGVVHVRLHGWKYLEQTFTVSVAEHVLMTLHHLVTNTSAPSSSALPIVLLLSARGPVSRGAGFLAQASRVSSLSVPQP